MIIFVKWIAALLVALCVADYLYCAISIAAALRKAFVTADITQYEAFVMGYTLSFFSKTPKFIFMRNKAMAEAIRNMDLNELHDVMNASDEFLMGNVKED